MLLCPHKIYYEGFLSQHDFLDLSREEKGEYLRFLNILTLGDLKKISLILGIEPDRVYEMMREFGLAPEGDSLEPEAPTMFYRMIKREEEKLLKKQYIDASLIVSVRRILSRFSVIALGRDKGAFDMAYDEVITSEIKAINDLFCYYRDDNSVYESLESFRFEQAKKIHDEVILNRLSDSEINTMLDNMQIWNDEGIILNTPGGEELSRMSKRKKVEHAKLTPEEREKYVSLEDVIGKPASEMTADDVQKAIDGCPIKPIFDWSIAKKDSEYLRQLRILFQHVTIKKMAHVLFGDKVSNGDLGKRFIALKVKVPAANAHQVGKYELENLVFDKWVSDGRRNEEVACHNEATQASNEAEITENNSAEMGEEIVDYNVATPSNSAEMGEEIVDCDEVTSVTAEDNTNEARRCYLTLRISGNDPVQLYEIYVEILKLYQDDPRGRVLYNPLMDA